MPVTRVPIIKYLKRAIPDYKRLGKDKLWEELEARRQRGEIQALIPVPGQLHKGQKIKLGPSKPQRLFFGFVETADTEPAASPPAAESSSHAAAEALKCLPLPKYATDGVARDAFFLAYLEIEVRAHYKRIEPRYRTRDGGAELLAEAVQAFAHRCIAEYLGKAGPAGRNGNGAQKRVAKTGGKKQRSKGKRSRKRRRRDGPWFVQGGAPQ